MRPVLPYVNDWQPLADNTLLIQDSLPISRHSRFGDDLWLFHDDDNPRLRLKSAHQLRINWQQYTSTLPATLVHNVKVLGVFFVHYPAVLNGFRPVSHTGHSPIYCCSVFDMLLRFLVEVCALESLPPSCIQTVADITLADMQEVLINWQLKHRRDLVRKLLLAFTSPLLQSYLEASAPPWTEHDIKSLDFKIIKADKPGGGTGFRNKPLPDVLFHRLVNVATLDVLAFLVGVGHVPHTPLKQAQARTHQLLVDHPQFNGLYQAFTIVTAIHRKAIEKGEHVSFSTLWSGYEDQFNIGYQDVCRGLERIETAAKYLLLQFSGIRFSEAALLQTGCIQTLPSGEYVLRGTVSKWQSIDLLHNVDYWVAAPIVRDAVAVLEMLGCCTKEEFLLAPGLSRGPRQGNVPIKNVMLVDSLNAYLYAIDEPREYSTSTSSNGVASGQILPPFRLTPHRLRHTLARHMSRAGLGIPLISFHLKHVYHAYKRFESVSEVTLGYGEIGNDIFHNATAMEQAHWELAHALHHPEAAVAGPGAAEYKADRQARFTGMLAQGWQADEIIAYFAEQGLLMTDVGLGYCRGRHEIEQEDGRKELPPCLGQLQCNPLRCKNAVIPVIKIPVWVQMYQENKQRLQDPLLAYAWPTYRHFMEEAQQVLLELGVPIEDQ